MDINETYDLSLLARAAYTKISGASRFERELFDAKAQITFTFANQAQANEVTDNYDFIWQYNDSLTGFSGSVFQEKSSSKPMPIFTRTEFLGDVVGAGVFVADPGLNGSIWDGQTVKTI